MSRISHSSTPILLVLFLCWLVLAGVQAPPLSAATLTGWLDVVWGDPQPGSKEASHLEFFLAEANGQVTEIVLSTKALAEAGGIMAIQRRFVEVEFKDGSARVGRLRATGLRI